MFTEGIEIDVINVFYQTRVIQGLQQDNDTFMFCPNLLVTKEIMKSTMKLLPYSFLMCGGFGMSKTVALLMKWHLSSYITALKFQAQQIPKEN
jgi:hypothetical protein